MSVSHTLLAVSFLEQHTWFANWIVAIAAIIALWQVRSAIAQAKCAREQNKISLEQLKQTAKQIEDARNDSLAKEEHRAKHLALMQCERYAAEIAPQLIAIGRDIHSLGNRVIRSTAPNFPKLPCEADPIMCQILNFDPDRLDKIKMTLNDLESIAMYFASGVADEKAAFNIIAPAFCEDCENFSFIIGHLRGEGPIQRCQSIVALYNMWKPRLGQPA